MEDYIEYNIIKAAKEMIDFIKKENKALSVLLKSIIIVILKTLDKNRRDFKGIK